MALRRTHYKIAEWYIERAENASGPNQDRFLAFAQAHASLASAPLEVALDAGNPE